MSTKAFVLIETSVGKTQEAFGKLSNVSELTSVDTVTGPYDIIAVVESSDLDAVGNIVTTRIHTIDGILRTVSCLSVSL